MSAEEIHERAEALADSLAAAQVALPVLIAVGRQWQAHPDGGNRCQPVIDEGTILHVDPRNHARVLAPYA